MVNEISKTPPTGNDSPFERIKRINAAGNEYWSSRDFAQILGYADYRNFEQVIKKAKAACFNSGHRIEDHFVDITEMVDNRRNFDGDCERKTFAETAGFWYIKKVKNQSLKCKNFERRIIIRSAAKDGD